MLDKPSKYGTKFYMTCCAETAYRSRVEVYCGATKPKKKKKDRTPDNLLGEAPMAVFLHVSGFELEADADEALSRGHSESGSTRLVSHSVHTKEETKKDVTWHLPHCSIT
ncbi:hypothetical protein PHMEG_0002212 [Phytophthora megakarya]|uniref:PiggyBac transposable element-derived protein domain-containing protein n=1 Tax=Phytophthora megakarya TaxID=4795 RepID=A0A225WZS7_9STRA|nr:hypothetical protein PHMEG_0002212 [Phytophthora megakarya]